MVLLEWAWRTQGLVVPQGNPKGIARPRRSRRADPDSRQQQSGSHLLLDHLLDEAGLERQQLRLIAPPARSEADVALAVAEGKADAGLAVETVARQFRLGFVALFRERYDLAVWRREAFERPLQQLLAFSRGQAFATRAAGLGGYDIAGLGAVHLNGP